MKYLSVCSGIEAATVAWHPLGWQPVGFAEIEPFPAAVLANHYPEVPNFGDMTKYKEWNLGTVELLVGGTPCQSFSVAGLRKGLADPRGNLALVYCGILDHLRPEWFVWENVPGVLSSNGGRDFGSFLGALAELGYGFAYRVLDAQYFGVAQRRRRVFVVGHLGNWRPAAEVLFERESVLGHPAPSREKGKEVAGTIEASLGRSRGAGTPAAAITARMVAFGEYVDDGTASAMKARDYKDATDLVAQPVAWSEELTASIDVAGTIQYGGQGGRHDGVAVPIAFNARQDPDYWKERSGPLDTDGSTQAVAAFKGGQGSGAGGIGYSEHVAPTLPASDGGNRTPTLLNGMAVRRLTPIECERLQGFPDNYTNIPWRRAIDSPDGPRYKALGNSMAVPVMKWIGERIKLQTLKLAS